ncbi:hypothetical protein OA387_01155 [Prochlorococcus sp. AH-716-M10]|nr:hypothetical protein [Prochlorococcus sp. AH-716-M10]
MKMFNLKFFPKLGLFIYIFIYLISPKLAITQNTKVDIRKNLENALNTRNLKSIKNIFKEDENLKIQEQFKEIIKDFPNSKWQIKRLSQENSKEKIFNIKVNGNKIVNGEIYFLESNFKYLFSIQNDKINNGNIKNLLTTIRNDQNKIDIIFRIPEKVLTGTKYDIDIILNEPLGDVLIAGGIISHQDDSYLKQEINIEPLASGGIFKTTRASSKPARQIWSGIIAHPKGTISFTKSVEIVEKM